MTDIALYFWIFVGFTVFLILIKIKDLIVYRTLNHNKIKGIKFEKKCVNELKKNGFDVFWRGKELGKKDAGIDIEAKKGDTLFLIQCKNYQRKSKIDGKLLRMFYGDVNSHLLKSNISINQNKIESIFVSYYYQLDASGKFWLKENPQVKYFNLRGFKKAIKNL